MIKVREGCSWLFSYLGISPWIPEDFGRGPGEGLGSAPLLPSLSPLRGHRPWSLWENSPALLGLSLLPSPAVSGALLVGQPLHWNLSYTLPH